MKTTRRELLILLVPLMALALASPAMARLGATDAEPAATLLLPYFEVDFANPSGINTVFSINNATADPAMVNVILWTDWGIPSLGFQVFLTGYDVVSIDLRDVFNGILPVTADEARDPGDDISPQGPISLDGSFPACEYFFPYENPVLGPFNLERVRNGHTGQFVSSVGNCLGQDLGDGIARGYVTMDNVAQCSLIGDPGDPGYFVDGGIGIATDANQLWGDWFIIDPANNYSQGDSLVHIEAHPDLNALQVPLTDTEGATVATVANATGYTFYGRYFSPPVGADNREPLGTIWAARYLNGGAFDEGTDLLVWRDSTADTLYPPTFWCGVGPDWYPLNETEIIVFDESENAVEICGFNGGVVFPPFEFDPACFPSVAGRHSVGSGDLSIPFSFGWLYMNLNLPPDSPANDADFGSSDNIAQSWVTTVHSTAGRFSLGLPALTLSGALRDVNDILDASDDAPAYP